MNFCMSMTVLEGSLTIIVIILFVPFLSMKVISPTLQLGIVGLYLKPISIFLKKEIEFKSGTYLSNP